MKPQLTNELKEQLKKRIGQQIEGTFRSVPLYDYIRYEQYRYGGAVAIKDGNTFASDDILASYVIPELKEAKNGYTVTVKVLGCERKVYNENFGRCNYDGFVFNYTTDGGRLSMPLKEVQKKQKCFGWA